MKRQLFSAFFVISLLISMLGLAFNTRSGKAQGGTIYIRADGSIDPPDAPISTVDNVTYTLTGNITSASYPDGIVIERSNITIDGTNHTLQGTGALNSHGIRLSSISNVAVKNTAIKGFYHGVFLYLGFNNTILENDIADNYCGIFVDSATGHSIVGNSITNNVYGGVDLFHSFEFLTISIVIANNSFANCGLSLSYGGIHGAYQNVVENNTVNGKPLVYLENVSDRNVSDAGQVVLVNCSNIRVESLDLSNATFGVELYDSTKSIIAGNNMSNNKRYGVFSMASDCMICENNITNNNYGGIWLYYSSDSSIYRNNITYNNEGIYLADSYRCNVFLNNIANNELAGISLSDCNRNIIMGNSLANNLEGISLDEADATITSNNITTNQIGIRFYESGGSTISGNGITNNTLGIHLTYAAQNHFYHNNFDNEEQVDCYWYVSRNTWDNGYPSGGNYWSDYSGTDADHNGIGDTPYIVDGNNSDRYPLMVPYITLSADYEIAAVYGSTPSVDGSISIGEWSDATSVFFSRTEVLVKQDGHNLFLGFNMSYSPSLTYDQVIVFVDVDNNGGLTLQPDDVGLVVYANGTLAEGNVTEGTWESTEVKGWSAETQLNPNMWQVEFNITYSKIKVTPGLEKNIGVVFMSTYAATTHYYWPPTMDDGNYGIPSEWGAITSPGHNWTSQHDVVIMNVSHKTVVGLGYNLNISVTAANQGDYPETFNVTVYANNTQIGTQPVALETGTSTNMAFTLNTTGVAYGTYTITAVANPVTNETNTADNNCSCNIAVHVGVPGDISGPTQGVYDGITNMRDISYMILLFTTNPSSPNWNPNADINNDATVNMRDISIAILNFNKHE